MSVSHNRDRDPTNTQPLTLGPWQRQVHTFLSLADLGFTQGLTAHAPAHFHLHLGVARAMQGWQLHVAVLAMLALALSKHMED